VYPSPPPLPPRGLSSQEAAARRARYGPNTLVEHRQRQVALEFLARFRNPLVLLLLAASAVAALTGEVTSFAIITVIVVVSVTLDFIQEYRAERAAERLNASVAVRATVLRDGVPREIPVAELVPGDVIHLSAGDLVPGDGRVLDARDFFVNQALLTGEPYPVEKHPIGTHAAGDDTPSLVCMGTSVISGTATVAIERTGSRTALGEIAETVGAKAPPTAFELGTQAFGLFIMRITLLLVLAVILINAALHRPWLESFLFALALAVGLTPELLPMVVSVCLARGALRMAARKVIVKRLAAIHDLGSMDVLCTDKTGTLTEARIQLEKHCDAAGRDSERVLLLAYLNSAFETGLRSPLDDAILRHDTHLSVEPWRKIDEVPFDFERRRISVLLDDGGTRLLVVKGAFEDVLRLSTLHEGERPDDLRPLDAAAAERLRRRFEGFCRDGYRVLGIAWRRVPPDHAHAVVDDETELVFAGYAAFLDPPKVTAGQAVEALTRAGVALKVVTGDNELVTQHLCAQLGLRVQGLATGGEIAQMDDHALQALVERVDLFCRVTPAQKNRIILALKGRGHVVGYLGDGINDAPSLHSADVGLSVDGAVDVARDAADLILLEHDLNVLHDGVLEGRRTFGNIMKYIMMATSSNFGNMFSMAAAASFLPFLPMLPVQILVNNLLYDLSELPIPMDEVDAEFLQRPRGWDMAFVRNFMFTVGPVSSLFDFLTFFLLLHVLHADAALFHTGWFVESLATQVLVIFIIRTQRNPLRSRPALGLTVASLGIVGVALALPLAAGASLGFVTPPPVFFLLLALMVGVYLVTVEAVKRWFYRRLGRGQVASAPVAPPRAAAPGALAEPVRAEAAR
jgi:Mg2+-importing ATPase